MLTMVISDGISHPVTMATGAGVAACSLALTGGYFSARHKRNKNRAEALQQPIRVVKRCSPEELACVISLAASPSDTVETVRYALALVSIFDSLIPQA
jgi:hypothetical protein